MEAINSLSQARQTLPARQQMAFKGNEQQKFHPGAATASLVLPGTGQIAKGEIFNGLVRLGIGAAAIGTTIIAGGRAMATGSAKWVAAHYTAMAVWVLTHVNSAFDAFKPKKN